MSNVMLIKKSDGLLYYINSIQRRTLLLIEQSKKISRHIKLLQRYNDTVDKDYSSCRDQRYVSCSMSMLGKRKRAEANL